MSVAADGQGRRVSFRPTSGSAANRRPSPSTAKAENRARGENASTHCAINSARAVGIVTSLRCHKSSHWPATERSSAGESYRTNRSPLMSVLRPVS